MARYVRSNPFARHNMAIEYAGIKFDTVQELIEYQQAIGELTKPTAVTEVSSLPKRAFKKKEVEQIPTQTSFTPDVPEIVYEKPEIKTGHPRKWGVFRSVSESVELPIEPEAIPLTETLLEPLNDLEFLPPDQSELEELEIESDIAEVKYDTTPQVKPYTRYPLTRLPEEQLARLGQEPDSVLAREWGVKKEVVARQRMQNRIPPFRSRTEIEKLRNLPPEEIEKLGKIPDIQLAQEWGISNQRIGELRRQLDIAPFDPEKDVESLKARLTHRQLRLIGSRSSKYLALRFGTSVELIEALKRNLEGLPPLPAAKTSQEFIITSSSPLAGLPLEDRRRGSGSVFKSRPLGDFLTEEEYDYLGSMPDTELAEKWGVSTAYVRKLRTEREIPPFRSNPALRNPFSYGCYR